MRSLRTVAAGLALLALGATHASAQQDYPNRIVKWVVGYPAGGATDIFARLIGQYLSVGSSRVDLQACKLEYSIVSPK